MAERVTKGVADTCQGGAQADTCTCEGTGSVVTGLSLTTLQQALNALGFRCRPDGLMGERTAAAIRDFQRNSMLPTTGQADEATRDAVERLRHAWEGKDYLV
ncbi:MAG: peptidoglycan-binding protein [Actinomycetia bacterium]|nr:peptidoglycan-binding protein [Actinomycetes bacterium]